MKRKLLALLCLVVACSSDDAVIPENNSTNNGPPLLMAATLWDKPFFGFDQCYDRLGPPAEAPGFWAENALYRLQVELPTGRMRTGTAYELGFDSFFSTPRGHYVVRDKGFGTCVLTHLENDVITGNVDAKLIHQRNLQDTLHLTGSFTANPYEKSLQFSGDAGGVVFESQSGGETFPRVRARVCVQDTTFDDGKGAVISITTLMIKPDFVRSYVVDEETGFARINVESGGEFYNAVDGSLNVEALDSVAVDSSGVEVRYQTIISRATFECVGVNLIVFGDENKDTVRVREGRVSLTGLANEN